MGHNLTIKDTDVKVLGRTVSITTDKTVAAAEQLVDESFAFEGTRLEDQSQYTINRLLKNKIIALSNGVPAQVGMATTEDNGYGVVRLATNLGDPVRNEYDVVTLGLMNPVYEDVEKNKGRLDKLEECCEEVKRWIEKKNPDVRTFIDHTKIRNVEFIDQRGNPSESSVCFIITPMYGYKINAAHDEPSFYIEYGGLYARGLLRSTMDMGLYFTPDSVLFPDLNNDEVGVCLSIPEYLSLNFDANYAEFINVYGNCSEIEHAYSVTVKGKYIQEKTIITEKSRATITVYPKVGYSFNPQAFAYDVDWQWIDDIVATDYCTVDPRTATVAFTEVPLNSPSELNGISLTIEVGNITQDTTITLDDSIFLNYVIMCKPVDAGVRYVSGFNPHQGDAMYGDNLYSVVNTTDLNANSIDVYIATIMDYDDIEHNKELTTSEVVDERSEGYYIIKSFDKDSSNYNAQTGWRLDFGPIYKDFWMEIVPVTRAFRSVTWTGENFTYTNTDTSVQDGSSFFTRVVANDGYLITDIVAMLGNKVGYRMHMNDGTLHSQFYIQHVTDDLYILVVTKQQGEPDPEPIPDDPTPPEIEYCTVTKDIDSTARVTYNGGDTVEKGKKYQATIKPKSNCVISRVVVTSTSTKTTIPSTYTASTGALITNGVVNEDITVTVKSHLATFNVIKEYDSNYVTFEGADTVQWGGSYTATITVKSGKHYNITGVTVTNSEGEVNSSWNPTMHTLNVAGPLNSNIKVTVKGSAYSVYTITKEYDAVQVDFEGGDGAVTVVSGQDWDATVLPRTGYRINSITVNGTTNYSYDRTTNLLTLNNIRSNISIVVNSSAIPESLLVTFNQSNEFGIVYINQTNKDFARIDPIGGTYLNTASSPFMLIQYSGGTGWTSTIESYEYTDEFIVNWALQHDRTENVAPPKENGTLINESLVTISPDHGTGNTNPTVVVSPNHGYKVRYHFITITGSKGSTQTVVIAQNISYLNAAVTNNNIWASPYTESFTLDLSHMYGEDNYGNSFFEHSLIQHRFDYNWGIIFNEQSMTDDDDNVLPQGYVVSAKKQSMPDNTIGVKITFLDDTVWLIHGIRQDQQHLFTSGEDVTAFRGNAGDIINIYNMTNVCDIDPTNSYLGLPQRLKVNKYDSPTAGNSSGHDELTFTKITDDTSRPTYGSTEMHIVDGNLNDASGRNGSNGLYSIYSLNIEGETGWEYIQQNSGRKITGSGYDKTATATIYYNGQAADLGNKTIRIYYGSENSMIWIEPKLDVRNNQTASEKFLVGENRYSGCNRFLSYPSLHLVASNNSDDRTLSPALNITVTNNQIQFNLLGNVVSSDVPSGKTMRYYIYIIDKDKDYDPTNDN